MVLQRGVASVTRLRGGAVGIGAVAQWRWCAVARWRCCGARAQLRSRTVALLRGGAVAQ
jgi:hypothetical protein